MSSLISHKTQKQNKNKQTNKQTKKEGKEKDLARNEPFTLVMIDAQETMTYVVFVVTVALRAEVTAGTILTAP